MYVLVLASLQIAKLMVLKWVDKSITFTGCSESATFQKGHLENLCFANGNSENVLVEMHQFENMCSENFKYKQRQ